MAKKIKFGNIIVCEHVVTGSTNKHILVNTYSGDIIVSELPARLTLGLYIEIKNFPDLRDMTIEINLARKTIAKLSTHFKDFREGDYSVIVLPMLPIEVDVDTMLSIYFDAAGYARTKALSKKIFLGKVAGVNSSTS